MSKDPDLWRAIYNIPKPKSAFLERMERSAKSDIVERLEAMSRYEHDDLATGQEAAEHIRQLRAERDALSAWLAQRSSYEEGLEEGIKNGKAAAVPEGFVVVPRVATDAMIHAGACSSAGYSDLKTGATKTWTAMVEAAGKENKE